MNLAGLPALLAWVKSQGVELLRGPAAVPQSTGFKPGEQYLGKVLENLGNGRSLVQIGNQTLDMRMPAQARQPQPGDTLRFTYLTSSARPTFVLDPGTGSSPARASVQVSSGAQQLNALAGYVRGLAAQPPGSTAAGASSSAPSSPGTAGATTTDAGSPATSARLSSAATQASALSRAVAAEVPQAASRAASAAAAPVGQAGSGVARAAPVGTPVAATPGATATTSSAPAPAIPSSAQIAQTVPAGPASGTLAAPAAQAAAATTGTAPLSLAQLAQQASQLSPQARPLLANPSSLLAASSAAAPSPGTPALTPGSTLPGLSLAGPALDAARAAMTTASSLNTQGMMLASGPGVLMLAQRLRQGMAESGLFYESHLGRWVRGGLSLEAVQREPQSRLLDLAARLLNLPGLDGMPEEAARLAGRQLLMLEGGPAAWHGTAWPGQEMSWLVEEGEGGGGEDDEDGPRWRTRLRLVLPVLGEVEAAIEINARGLGIDLEAADTETRGRLHTALPALVAQLQAAELPLTRLRVLDPREATEGAHAGA